MCMYMWCVCVCARACVRARACVCVCLYSPCPQLKIPSRNRWGRICRPSLFRRWFWWYWRWFFSTGSNSGLPLFLPVPQYQQNHLRNKVGRKIQFHLFLDGIFN